MIKYVTGNLLESNAYALINTVNTVGIMGKGIALQFKNEFPHNYTLYKEACKFGKLKIGELLTVKDSSLHLGERLIINFPTKTDWRLPSQYGYIEKGLQALVALISHKRISIIALPSLGCGNGGLDWHIVRKMIETYLGDLDIAIEVYEPSA